MREILFRGKRTDNGEWVHGYYGCIGGMYHYIYTGKIDITKGFVDHEKYEVDFETVGQFTGLTTNGKKIFEGDIVKTHYANTKKNDFVEQVVFHNGKFCSLFKMSGGGKMYAILADGIPHLPQDKLPYMEWCEIIGNIHDNPELLKGEE